MPEPPPGYEDCIADGEMHPTPPDPKYYPIEVPGVGLLHARYPLPNAIPVLAGIARAKVSDRSRANSLTRFVQGHLAPGEFEALLDRMVSLDPDLPEDAMTRVTKAIATGGTERPTVPSSPSH